MEYLIGKQMIKGSFPYAARKQPSGLPLEAEIKSTKGVQKLRLKLSVSDATPWPALKVCVHALLPDTVIPISDLEAQAGGFLYQKAFLSADPLDALLLRTLLQQPRADSGSYLVGARDFAAVLALLRQHSNACEYDESARVSRLEILSEAPHARLELTHAEGHSIPSPRVLARRRFRCSLSGDNLGEPLFRTASFWTFQNHITPAPELPVDPILRYVFESEHLSVEHTGEGALEFIQRAQAAAHAKELLLHIDGTLSALSLTAEPLCEQVRVDFDQTGDLVIERTLLTPQGKTLEIENARGGAIDGGKLQNGGWVESGGRFYRLPRHADSSNFKLPSTLKLSGDAIPDFIANELPRLKEHGAVIGEAVQNATISHALKPCVRVSMDAPESQGRELNGALSDGALQAQWFFEPLTGDLTGTTETSVIEPVEILAAAARAQRYIRRGNLFIRVDRDAVTRARTALQQIAACDGAEFTAENEQIPELISWTRRASSNAESPWNVYISESVDGAHKVKDEPAAVRFCVDVDEEDDKWFTLEAQFDHSGEVLDEDDLRKLVSNGKKWFRKNNTWIKADAGALARFEQSVHKSGAHRFRNRKKTWYKFRPADREHVTEIFSLSGTLQHAERYRKFLDRLRGFDRIQNVDMPKTMPLTLRPYQQAGFEWLVFLYRHGLNGILADDMGLGKTAQTIALLTRVKDEGGPAPTLIVAPTSLLDNWRNELARFSPTLSVMIYRGAPQRRDQLREKICGHDVVLGTYATIRNDAMLLHEIEWRYVILDEAHFIKNSAAATTKALKTIPAQHRLALTGTPIQNRLTELWSLFDFLMPGFLGRQMRFRENYEDPIARVQSGRAETQEERDQGEHAMEHLRERIRPFVLRRLKTEVARDLPPKIENDIFCRLCAEQTSLYRGFSESAEAKEAVNQVVQKGADHARAAILAALMSLRKICNHADLMCLPKNEGRQHIVEPLPGYENRSGKLEALGELLQQCVEGGHRALIFCQLTSMLDIIAHYLTRNGMTYLRLDGETPGGSRQALVERFNTELSLNAFLISTRAGGAGLNLTGADTVIFYDHDWNPANDQQAQDRAYRIGQLKTVNVYRLICKGTLEEKILRRQQFKKMLAGSIVQQDAASMQNLTRDDLLSLFTLTEEAEANNEQK